MKRGTFEGILAIVAWCLPWCCWPIERLGGRTVRPTPRRRQWRGPSSLPRSFPQMAPDQLHIVWVVPLLFAALFLAAATRAWWVVVNFWERLTHH